MKRHIETLFAGVAALALFAMMALTLADVIGRKFFDQSLTGAVEVTEILMMMMIFFALPLASLAGEHVVFDLLDRVLPKHWLRWQRLASHVLTGLIWGGSAWIVWQRAGRTLEYGDITATLGIALWPFHHLVALLLLVTAIVHGVLALQAARGLAARELA